MKCVCGNRCIRCRKINLKREVKKYQEARRTLFEESTKDSCGNIIVHPDFVQRVLNQRAKVGKMARNLQNRLKNDISKPLVKLETLEDYTVCLQLRIVLEEAKKEAEYMSVEDMTPQLKYALDKHIGMLSVMLNEYTSNKLEVERCLLKNK
jgi:hypothetical protein